MIIGVGVDIIDVARIHAAIENPRTGARFQARVFSEQEIAYCRRRHHAAESFAARFAAKEATMKALGRGFGQGIAWREIEVRRDDGAPGVRLSGGAQAYAEALGIRRIHLSLSHTADLAVAYVIAES
jgi:holo-[acyl-carrier protein] synthase